MPLAEELTALNEWHFFSEFVYLRNAFKPMSGQEVGHADSLVWLGDLLIGNRVLNFEFIFEQD